MSLETRTASAPSSHGPAKVRKYRIAEGNLLVRLTQQLDNTRETSFSLIHLDFRIIALSPPPLVPLVSFCPLHELRIHELLYILSRFVLPVFWTFTRSDDTDTSESLQTASTDCKSFNKISQLGNRSRLKGCCCCRLEFRGSMFREYVSPEAPAEFNSVSVFSSLALKTKYCN